MKRRIISVFVFLIMILQLVSCGKKQIQNGKTEYTIYLLDRNEDSLHSVSWYSDKSGDELINELILKMSEPPKDVELREVIRGFEIVGMEFNEGSIILDVSDDYRSMPPTCEILVRAAIVRTLCQVDGVDYISMKCHGEDLQDALAQTIGPMNESQFIDNEGNEVNSYERVELTLYFASADGKKLKKIYRTLEYNSNISMEKLVVEQLIRGPLDEKYIQTINPQTEIVNVTLKDGTCYVNLNEAYLSLPENITPDISIYSIVNSLAELSGVNKVEISINGDSNLILGEETGLDTMFERNLEMVE